MSAQRFGQLYRGRSDGAGCAVDDDALPIERVGLLQAGQRDAGAVTDGRGLLVAHGRRLVRKRAALSNADVLGVRAVPPHAEDLVADLELRHRAADCDDDACELHAGCPVLRPQHAGEEAREERFGGPEPAIRAVDRRCANLDEDFVVLRLGALDLLDAQDLGRSVTVEHDCSHRLTSSHRFVALGGSGRRGPRPGPRDRARRVARPRNQAAPGGRSGSPSRPRRGCCA